MAKGSPPKSTETDEFLKDILSRVLESAQENRAVLSDLVAELKAVASSGQGSAVLEIAEPIYKTIDVMNRNNAQLVAVAQVIAKREGKSNKKDEDDGLPYDDIGDAFSGATKTN